MTHDELMNDLATHLSVPDRMVWTNLQLGPAHSPRPDVYTLQKSYAHPNPMAYECKVSVSDFRSDVTSGKWHAYLEYACGVVFACPAGLISKPDLPPGCGLIVRGEQGWRAMRKATLKPVQLPEEALLKLLIDGIDRVYNPAFQMREFNEWEATEKIRQKFGDRVAEVVRDLDGCERRVKDSKERALKMASSG